MEVTRDLLKDKIDYDAVVRLVDEADDGTIIDESDDGIIIDFVFE
jgi:hypothetical protein